MGAFFRQLFTRVPSSVAFIPQVDGVRAFAMLMVIAHHVFAFYLEDTHRLGTQQLPRDWARIAPLSPLVHWALHLALGIQIFFVISGFVLAIPFARNYQKGIAPPSIKLYLLRRLIRVEPPYVVSMVFFFLLLMTRVHTPPLSFYVAEKIFGLHLLASLVYLHGTIYGGASWINGAAWTLEIEIQFYLLMPLIVQLFRNRRNGLRQGIWIVLILASALFAQYVLPQFHSARLDLSIASQLQYFLAGIFLADIYLDRPAKLKLGPYSADLLALTSVALVIYIMHWREHQEWIAPLLVAAFCYAVLYGRWTSRLFALPALTIPGAMCYSIYLYHIFIVKQLLPFTIRLFPPVHALWLDSVVQFVLLVPPIVAVSAVIFLAIERPFVVLSHETTRRFRSAAIASAPAPVAREVGA